MKPRQPTKEDIIAALLKINSRDGHVSQAVFKKETGWDRYWFDKHWPTGGYQSACIEAGVMRGAIFGLETNVRVTDEELAIKFAEATQSIGKIPSRKRFVALSRTSCETFCRGDGYPDAKRRILTRYFELPAQTRKGGEVDRILEAELKRLNGKTHTSIEPLNAPPLPDRPLSIQVPSTFVETIRQLRDRGEEEKRQLVVQFFHEILGYIRARVRSEHKHNDVQVHDRRDQPWLVVEVKPLLETERERRAARRQGFDYAHRQGMRFVVISDGDFYEIYDRCAGQRLTYGEMRQGSFHLTALRLRDDDLINLLARER
jgi:hypothetical protein